MSLNAQQIFEEKISARLKERVDKVKAINAIYEFNLTGDNPSTWSLDLTKESDQIIKGSTGHPQCTITIAETDLSDIVEGKLNPQMAFMSGKLKVVGDMSLALKLGNIL